MSKIDFINKNESFSSGLFTTVPQYNQNGTYILLTGGVAPTIQVDEYTTSRNIRAGKYTKIIGVSQATYPCECTLMSPCREMTYKFIITLNASVCVKNPVCYYENVDNIDSSDYLSITLKNPIRQITKKYSILNYNDMEEELTDTFLSQQYSDTNSGLMYEIRAVSAEPDEETKATLRRIDNMVKENEINKIARGIADDLRHKTYIDVIMEEVAKDRISHADAIKMVEEYNKSNFNEKLEMLKKLRYENIILESDYNNILHDIMPNWYVSDQRQIEVGKRNNDLLEDGYPDEE